MKGEASSAAARADAPASRSGWLPRLLLAASVALAALGLWTVRVVVAGEAELVASTAALDAGDPREATVRARRAARWYAPGAPHVSVAYRRMIALARAAEEHRRRDIALLAWRSVRAAAIETRWLVTPHAADLALANREIARLMASGEHAAAKPDAAVQAAQLAALERPQGPRLGWVIALVAGLALATVGLAWWSRSAAGVAGRIDWRRARGPLALTFLGAASWLAALWQA